MKPTDHCQICGRLIQAKTGLIAHHGYTRKHGWQTASCFGARYRPYEVACDALPSAIESISQFIDRTEAALQEHLTNPPRGIEYRRNRNAYGIRDEWWTVLRPAGWTRESPDDFRPVTYTNLYHKQRRALESEIKAAKETQAELEKRLADWRPI